MQRMRAVWRELIQHQPLPDPAWYVKQQAERSVLPLSQRLGNKWSNYIRTWTDYFEEKERQRKEFAAVMDVQKQAAQKVKSEASQLGQEVSPLLQDYIRTWVGVYQVSVAEFIVERGAKATQITLRSKNNTKQ
eukprot:m.175860 g.175860  ORF g.175860 m.175860 type:complete len:133 (-) comp14625_c1_seq2:348-746(-)